MPRRRRKKKGGSLFGDILGGITSLPAGALMGATAGLQGAIKGLGKPKRKRRPRKKQGGASLADVKRVIGAVAKTGLAEAKKAHVISNVIKNSGVFPYSQVLGGIARTAGFGKKKRRRKRGGSMYPRLPSGIVSPAVYNRGRYHPRRHPMVAYGKQGGSVLKLKF